MITNSELFQSQMRVRKNKRDCLDGVHESLAVDLDRWVIQLQRVTRTGPFECAHFSLER